MASGDSDPPSALNIASPAFTEVQNLRVAGEAHVNIHHADAASSRGVRLLASQSRDRLEEGGQMDCTLDTELVGDRPSRFVQTDLNQVLWVGPCNDVIVANQYIDVAYHLNNEAVRTLLQENCSPESVEGALGQSLAALEWSSEKIVQQKLMAFKLKVLDGEVPNLFDAVIKLIDSPHSPSRLVDLVAQAFRDFGAQLRAIKLGSLVFVFQHTDEAKADEMLGSVDLQGRMIGCLCKFLPEWVRVHARWEVQTCLETEFRPAALCDGVPSVVWRLPVSSSPFYRDSQTKEAVDVEMMTRLMEPMMNRSVEQVVDIFSKAIAPLHETLNHMYSVVQRLERSQAESSRTPSISTAQTRTVIVQGLDPSTTEDTVQIYFENSRRSGGGEVEDVQYKEGSAVARVTFKDEEAVARVLKKEHRLDSRTLHVSKDSGDSVSPSVQHQGEGLAGAPSISYIDFSSSDSEDLLFGYLHSRRRGGGKKGKDVQYKKGSGVARVTFQDEEDAARVAARSHTITRRDLEVHLERSQPYADRLQLKNLPPLQTVDELRDFVQVQSNHRVKAIHFGDAGDLAVITFRSPIDFRKVEAAITRKPLKGHKVTVSPVPQSSTILVKKPLMTEGALKIYFASPKPTRGLGGEVSRVKMDKSGQYALVTFSDPEVALRVSTGQHYTMLGQPLSVSLYLQCLGVSGGRLEPSGGPSSNLP